MIATPLELRPLLEEFLGILDQDIRLEETALGHLGALAEAMRARDEAALRQLMGEADAAQEQFAAADGPRRTIRTRLAQALGWKREETTLSRLVRELPGADALRVAERKRRLERLVDQVRRRHLKTSMLLAECARLNRMLLAGLVPQLETLHTYGTAGLDPWRPGAGLLDTRS